VTTQQNRPAWVEKAAEAVTALYQKQQQDVAHAKEHMQATQTKFRSDVSATKQQIADIIHRHYQEHK